jgi:hypothetical protein
MIDEVEHVVGEVFDDKEGEPVGPAILSFKEAMPPC